MKRVILVTVLMLGFGSWAQAQQPTVESLDEGWNAIATDGVCSAGTPYQFYARTVANAEDLLIYFNGGGACWFGQACDLNSQPNIHTPFADMDANNPATGDGIFALDNRDNPFANYDMVFVPYCNGDVHIGAGPRNYSYTNASGDDVDITAYHNGYSNSSTVLDWVYENYAEPGKIVLAGSSAGAIGSSFYAGIVAEHYSQADVVLIADGAGGYGSPLLHRTINAWDVASVLPDWPEYKGQDNDSLTFEDFYIASANHNPNLTISQYNTAEDQTQIQFTLVIGDPPGSFKLPERILNNFVKIESAVDEFYSYTAGGDVHTIFRSPIFYEYEVEGVRFVDWVKDLVDGKEVADISCVREVQGCSLAPGSD